MPSPTPGPTTATAYHLIDSGNGQKLERVGPHLLVRPAPQAVWRPVLGETEWQAADAVFIRKSDSHMEWKVRRPLPDEWPVAVAPFTFLIKATGFGHLGLFPEQRDNWAWIARQSAAAAAALGRPPQVLNLFAYTGGSTLAALAGGASATHLDASRGVVGWAQQNAALSDLSGAECRWIVDDVKKFVKRELRRARRYDGIILDPPSFGRGNKGEVWKIEADLAELLDDCRALIPGHGFVVLSCHSLGFSPVALSNLLTEMKGDSPGKVECGEMLVPETASERQLPSGAYARWGSWAC